MGSTHHCLVWQNLLHQKDKWQMQGEMRQMTAPRERQRLVVHSSEDDHVWLFQFTSFSPLALLRRPLLCFLLLHNDVLASMRVFAEPSKQVQSHAHFSTVPCRKLKMQRLLHEGNGGKPLCETGSLKVIRLIVSMYWVIWSCLRFFWYGLPRTEAYETMCLFFQPHSERDWADWAVFYALSPKGLWNMFT